MEVELKQLVGQKVVGAEIVEVSHPIDRVYLGGTRVGWLARQDYAKFAPTVKLDRGVQRDLIKRLAELRAEEGLYLPSAEVGGGVPSKEQFEAAMDVFEEEETEDDDE